MDKICGVYKIVSPSGKIYIGQSINVLLRWHHYKLGRSSGQPKLHASFLKHGIKNHKFYIIQECEKEELNGLEKYYVDLFQTFNSKYGLNVKDGGGHRGKRLAIVNVEISCACGCDAKLMKHDDSNRARSYVSGHNPSAAPLMDKIIACVSSGNRSLRELAEYCNGHHADDVKSVASRLAKSGRIVRIKRGCYGPVGSELSTKHNPIVACACGCKLQFYKFDAHGRVRKFASGHNGRKVAA